MLFKIAHLYPKELNLYGDSGNIYYISYFLKALGIKSCVINIEKGIPIPNDVDFIFAGGGPDSLQKSIYSDFILRKSFLKNYFFSGKPSLFICGSYQLLGHYYLTSDNKKIKGLGIFDFYTYSPSNQKNRLIGNAVVKLDNFIVSSTFPFSSYLVGFQNHNGRTVLSSDLKPLGKVVNSNLGNTEKGFEGFYFKKVVGSYMHGPLLVKNPHILYFLLSSYLNKSGYFKLTKDFFYSEYLSHYDFLQKNIQ